MAKVVGFPATVTLDDGVGAATDISNDVTSLSCNTPYGVQVITGVDKSAAERLVLSSDGTGTLNGVFNPALSHAVLATTTVSGIARTLALAFPGPQTLGGEIIVSDYTVVRDAEGSLVWSAAWELTGGTALGWT